ncbi:MAG: energy transducer TonB [Planctomycetales bacterium]|nr:energy transducer TonB [Planctomycetales bacterium]
MPWPASNTNGYSPSLFKAWTTSGVVHGVALGFLAVSGATFMRVNMASRSGEIQLEASMSVQVAEPEHEQEGDVPVVVMPQSVQIAAQEFRFEPTNLAPVAAPAPRKIELARAELPRQSTSAAEPHLESTQPRPSQTKAIPRAEPLPATLSATAIEAAAETTGPDFRDNPPPVYPTAAYAAKLEGTVLLELTVAIDGRVSQVHVLRSSGHAILDGAAVNAVKQWRGAPARLDGRPVETTETLPIRFQLR